MGYDALMAYAMIAHGKLQDSVQPKKNHRSIKAKKLKKK
ncbi:hypothetical protein VCHA53O466_50342 [Vibrio chagasii]|nr:hypothetical protein VCHA53O466_50342 [Vibrio chagasii]